LVFKTVLILFLIDTANLSNKSFFNALQSLLKDDQSVEMAEYLFLVEEQQLRIYFRQHRFCLQPGNTSINKIETEGLNFLACHETSNFYQQPQIIMSEDLSIPRLE